MDVTFWGPSGWRLLHLITFTIGGLDAKKQMLNTLGDILPCKYCRASAKQFLKKDPVQNNVAVWLYEFHDKVNEKLEGQHAEDPAVPLPVPTPPFETVVDHYRHMLANRTETYPGRDFLLSIAFNYDKDTHKQSVHTKFWDALLKLYPYYEFRKKMFMPNFHRYFEDVYEMFREMGCEETFRETESHISSHKSGCKRKRQKTKSCRTKKKIDLN